MSSTGSGTADAAALAVSELQALVPGIEVNQAMKLTYVVALTVLVYEHLITLDSEIRYLRARRLRWAQVVFILNRYLITLQTFSGLATSPRGKSCVVLDRFGNTTTAILYVVWAAFSGLRVYAVSGHNNKTIASLVVVLALAPLVTNIAFDVMIQPVVIPIPDVPPALSLFCGTDGPLDFADTLSCTFFVRHRVLEVLTRICLLLSEATVILVIAIRAWTTFCKQRQLLSLMTLMLREGALYFIARMFLDVLYLVTAILPNQDLPFLIRLFFDVVPPILISRFYINLDEWDRRPRKLN
ncbi:hypothetical protein C8Q80DRAFT_1270597 [Daedaleopsis nitida]|nr:hypothetical protein C8Q80DRAFT_1270597 [Daedaleopsis nitida]